MQGRNSQILLAASVLCVASASNLHAGYLNGDANDTLDPQFDASHFATQLISSSGPIGKSMGDSLYSVPSAVIGAPNLWFYDGLGDFSNQRVSIVDPPYYQTPDFQPLVTQLNNKSFTGTSTPPPGTIEVKMGAPIYADPTHPYGIDFTVYGNSSFIASSGGVDDDTNLNSLNITGLNGHSTSVSVSPDGTHWYTYPDTQSLLPYNAYEWNSTTASWSNQATDQLKPVNPGIDSMLPGVTSTSVQSTTAGNASNLYYGASGGTGFSLSQTGFTSIQYIKVTPGNQATLPNSTYTVINAFAATRSMVVGDGLSIAPDNITGGTNTLYFQDPGNSSQTFISAKFSAVNDAAGVSTGFVTDPYELSLLPGKPLATYQLGATDLPGNSTLNYSVNLSLFAGYGYTGTGGDLSVLSWNGSSWSPQPFTFSAATDMVQLNGIISLSSVAITSVYAKGPLVWSNAAKTGVWNAAGDANWNQPGVVYNDGSDVVLDNSFVSTDQTIVLSSVVSPSSMTVNNSGGSYTVTGTGSITGITGITKTGSQKLVLATSNSYSGATVVNQGILELAVKSALPANNALVIASGATVIADSNVGTLVLNSLSSMGTLDLNNNGLIVHDGELASIVAHVTSSKAAGDVSRLTTLGIIQNTSPANGGVMFSTAFDGVTGLSLASSDVLAMYTYYGDANLDGHVDGSDYSLLDNGFLQQATGWQNGDFNYDGVINGSDYSLIDNAYNRQGASFSSQYSPQVQATTEVAVVPEPSFFGVCGLVGTVVSKRRRRRAFTLVELLVVVSIITLLIGIILPSLNRARETAKRVVCLSNLHQLVVAANSYVVEYKGYYPVAQYSVPAAGGGGSQYAWDFTTVIRPGLPKAVIPGLLWGSHGTNTKIQQCPSFDGASNAGGDPYTGYNYNTSYIGHGQGEFGPQDKNGIVPPAKVNQIRDASRTALFGDGQYGSGADKFMRAPWPNPNDSEMATGIRTAGTQGFRHQGQTNVAFCDGHAESLGKRFTSCEESDVGLHPAAGCGFLSQDNSLYGSSSPIINECCPD